jgi:uncharacterized membrane protein YfcA
MADASTIVQGLDDPAFASVLVVAGVVSGATAAVLGFGIGSLLTPLLITRLDPHLAVAVVALPHLIATAVRFFRHRNWIDRAVLRRFGVPSAIGGIAGALLQEVFRSPALIFTLAILLILTGIANLSHGFGGWRPGGAAATMLGLLSGIFGGLVGNQGGLRAAGLTAFDLQPRAYLATSTAVALMIDVARTPVYLARAGDAVVALAVPITAATIGCIAGTIAGERLFLRIPAARYRTVVGLAVLALGVWLAWSR